MATALHGALPLVEFFALCPTLAAASWKHEMFLLRGSRLLAAFASHAACNSSAALAKSVAAVLWIAVRSMVDASATLRQQ